MRAIYRAVVCGAWRVPKASSPTPGPCSAKHRANLRSHFDRARETGRPLFVTSKGHPDAVVLSPEAYDDLAERAAYLDSLLALEAGMADVKAGRTQPVDEALRAISAELGLDLDR